MLSSLLTKQQQLSQRLYAVCVAFTASIHVVKFFKKTQTNRCHETLTETPLRKSIASWGKIIWFSFVLHEWLKERWFTFQYRYTSRHREAESCSWQASPPNTFLDRPSSSTLPPPAQPVTGVKLTSLSLSLTWSDYMAFTPHNIITHIYWWNASICSTMEEKLWNYSWNIILAEFSECETLRAGARRCYVDWKYFAQSLHRSHTVRRWHKDCQHCNNAAALSAKMCIWTIFARKRDISHTFHL